VLNKGQGFSWEGVSTIRPVTVMHNPTRFLLSFTSLAVALAVAATYPLVVLAQGQGDDDDMTQLIEEVIVTASRRAEELQDVAMAVAVIDPREYADAGLTGLANILPFVPGVSVIDSGATFFSPVYIRGINAALSAGVTSYIDEIPFGSSTVYTNPTPLDGTLLDLGTLDVIKGPQGTLYGASAMGGILKFNTRDPSLEDWTGSVSADLSSTDGGGLNQLYRMNLNGPLAKDTLGVSLTGFWSEKTGYIDNVVIPRDHWDDYEYYGGSGSIRWAATDNLEVEVLGFYQKSTQDGVADVQANYAQDMLLPGIGAGEPWYGEYQTGEADVNPSEYEAQLLGWTVKYDFEFGTLTYTGSTQEMKFVQSLDATVPFAGIADALFPENAPHTQALFVGDLGFDKDTQELRLVSNSNETFEWIAGAFYTSEDGHNIQRLDTTPPEPNYYSANFPSNYTEWSVYATGTYYFSPKFDGSLGIRYADYSNDVVLNTVGPLVAPLPFSEIDDDVTNVLFNLRYRATDNTSYYARIASGYRPGGANFLLLDAEGNPLSQPFYEPDSLWSYEIGMKGTSGDGRWNYDLAAFYIDWEDYIVNMTVNSVTVATNADKAMSRGFETSLGFAATDALTITAVLSYINAELGSNEPIIAAPDGTQLPNTPEWQGALDFDYRFNLGELPAYAGLAWRYKDSMPVGYPGYTDSSGTMYAPSSPRLDLSSYSLVDLRAGFSAGAFDFSFYVTNVFDEWAWVSFSSTNTAISTGTPTRPRTYGAVVRWNFF
jgi:iron complex outermembrane receptor protein